jgi:hypothetical protein
MFNLKIKSSFSVFRVFKFCWLFINSLSDYFLVNYTWDGCFEKLPENE